MKGEYNLKGNAFNNLKEYINQNPKGGKDFAFYIISNRFSIGEIIISSAWYNVEIYYKIMDDYIKASGQRKEVFIERLAEWGLERDLNGIYRFFMRLGGPEKILNAALPNVKTYFDYITMTVISHAHGTLVFRSELPSKFVDLAIPADKGAVKGMLKACGKVLKNFEVKSTSALNDKISEIIYEVNY